MLSMQTVAALASPRLDTLDLTAELPRPNIYWATIDSAQVGRMDTYVAADHTLPAVRKVVAWCEEHRGIRINRSNSMVRMRRLKLADLLESPEVWTTALGNARAARQLDIVQALERLPGVIANKLGLSCDVSVAAAHAGSRVALWDRLCSEVQRTLRPAL